MYIVFVYGYSFETKNVYITDEYEYNTFEEALRRVSLFDNDTLFEITKDVPYYDCFKSLKTIARPACMRALVNTYYSRW